MMRPSVIVVAVSMLAACGGLAYLHNTREEVIAEPVGNSRPATAKKVESSPSPASPVTSTDASANTVTTAPTETDSAHPTPTSVAQWIKDTQSPDPKVRAAAIAALANAPKAQAMPALERVLETGEPDVDRHIALRSMHSLALRDGDATGQIRDAMRHAIYHGDDDGVTQTAQSLLDDIEAAFAQRE